MSLGIVFKGPEGIVIAADSRVTLHAQLAQSNGKTFLLPSTFDNASKLLKVNGQNFVGVVTFGLGTIGNKEPRTAHSFIPEFEAEVNKDSQKRMTVENFANALSDFFMHRWSEFQMPNPNEYDGDPMVFLVAGYDDEISPYGCVYEIMIPKDPKAKEKISNEFGAIWGGQREFVDRLLNGYDSNLPQIAKAQLNLDDNRIKELENVCKKNLSIKIPYQFLPLQDCVDLSIFLIRATINLQQWTVGIRGVGGAIDVATITRIEGFKAIQQKQITGEKFKEPYHELFN
jgi:hypothetical protein